MYRSVWYNITHISPFYNGKLKKFLKLFPIILRNWLGDFIEISGNVKADLTLECDLCLKEFEYKLEFDINETYAKNTLLDEYGQETELKDGQFIIDLEGSNEIDICDLLYQSVILNIPNKKVCGINCNKGVFQTDEEFVEEDPRMEVFKHIKLDK